MSILVEETVQVKSVMMGVFLWVDNLHFQRLSFGYCSFPIMCVSQKVHNKMIFVYVRPPTSVVGPCVLWLLLRLKGNCLRLYLILKAVKLLTPTGFLVKTVTMLHTVSKGIELMLIVSDVWYRPKLPKYRTAIEMPLPDQSHPTGSGFFW